MNFSVKDDPVAAKADALAAELAGGALTNAEIVSRVDALLPAIRKTVERYREQCSHQNDAVREWLSGRAEHPMQTLQSAPLVLFPGISREAVIACWREQLNASAQAVRKIVADDESLWGEWLYYFDRLEGRAAGRPFFRVEQLRDCFREIARMASLLNDTPKELELRKGATLFSDDFSKSGAGWNAYGTELHVSDGWLSIQGMGVTVWCEQDFSDACVSFDYQPVSASGDSFGALFAFPGSPNGAYDYGISAGAMDRYNHGINTYHVSLCRGNSGRTNLRRAGNGLKLLSTVEPDACRELGRTYRVQLIKFGESVQVIVDGKLIHACVDAGCYGPPPAHGRFGVRHFGGPGSFHTRYKNFEITELRAIR